MIWMKCRAKKKGGSQQFSGPNDDGAEGRRINGTTLIGADAKFKKRWQPGRICRFLFSLFLILTTRDERGISIKDSCIQAAKT
jgi:hypothetical protein